MYLTKFFSNADATTDQLSPSGEGQASSLSIWLNARNTEGWVLDKVVVIDDPLRSHEFGRPGILAIMVSDPGLTVTATAKLRLAYPALAGKPALPPAPQPFPPAPQPFPPAPA